MADVLDGADEARIRAIVRDEVVKLGLIDSPGGSRSLIDQIKRTRLDAGLTQAELAKRIGIGVSRLGQIEAGTLRLLPRQMDDIAAALGTRIVLVDLPEVSDARD